MGSIPIARSILAAAVLLLGPALARPAALRADPAPSLEALLKRGNAAYRQGDAARAVGAYEGALAVSSSSLAALLNGAVALEDLGRQKEAARWLEKAAALSGGPDVVAALGWAQWKTGDLSAAATSFTRALARDPRSPRAWLGLARIELAGGRAEEALKDLDKAQEAAPLWNLVPFYRGQAYELLQQTARAEAAFREAVINDSYFTEGRDALGRVQIRRGRYDEAWRQYSRILDADPGNRRYWSLLHKVQPMLTRSTADIRPVGVYKPVPAWEEASVPGPRVPRLRVGLGTNSLGKPRARDALVFRASSDFLILEPGTMRRLAQGAAGSFWRARFKRAGKRRLLVLTGPTGKTVLERGQPILIRPRNFTSGVIAIDEVPGSDPDFRTASKVVRGDLEVAPVRNTLRLVNVLDLETYTHGVVSAEMPIQSPIEALKAQAVIARSHALFIKQVTRRHRREGYDVCDGEHCQVYAGLRAESRRSREIVNATRGRVVTYKGRVAHVIYSSNCGGHTQSGKDLKGWGDVPYWSGIPDGNDLPGAPDSPWGLRTWLYGMPPAYCKPSTFVYPSHFRWSRVIRWGDLEEKLHRKLAKLGSLVAVRPLKRSPSGNVNLLLIEGTKRKVRIDSEMQIRGLLGIGSLRSTLFVAETELGADGKPEALVLHGGGWGHAVGLCQSGAMGRAEAGQTFEEIIRAYFKGTELGQLSY